MQLNLDSKQILSSQSMSQQSSDQRQKIQLLWNVADPDDPYDIRKSMISSLPRHTQNFMGGNLQIVCLMQAAQIERLNIYLSEFKSKYRQLQRIQLDRHLYEVQIKQLAQKAKQNERFKLESEKLKQYIKRLTLQMQQLNKKPNIPLSLQTEHQQLRRRYQSLLTQLKNVRQTISNNNITINKLTEQNLQLRMKYDRLDKQRLTELTQQREKYEIKIRQRIEIQIRQVQSRLNNRITQLQSDCRLYKQQLESKNHEISSLIAKNQSLRQQLDRHKNIGNLQSANKISQLQAINQQLSRKASELQYIFQQYTRIQMRLKQAQAADRKNQQQNRFLKQQITRIQSINQRQIQIYVQKIQQQENKIALLSSEIQRLSFISSTNKNEVDKKYNDMRDDYEIKIKHIIQDYELKLIRARDNRIEVEKLQAELRSLRSINQQIRSKNQSLLNEITFISRKLSEVQSQNQRIKSSLITREDQFRNYERTNESLNMENMSLRKSLMEKDRISSNIQSERANYESKIKQLVRQVQKKEQLLKELQSEVYRNHKLAENYQNARSMLAQNDQYIQRLKKELTDAKRRTQQYQIDLKNGTIIPIAILEQQLRRNTQQITIKIRLQQQLQIRKYIEQKTLLEKQISKLIQQNRHLEQQFIQLQQKLSRRDQQGRQNITIIENRYVSQITDLTNSVKVLKDQNQRIVADRNRLRNVLTDHERLIDTKQREYGEAIRESNRRAEEFRVGNQQLKLEIMRIRQQLNASQEGNQRLQRQIQEKLIKIYNSQLQQKDNIISTLERQVKAAREEIKSLQATYQNSNSTIKNYKQRLLNLSQQIKRLNDLLKQRGDLIEDYKKESGYNKSKDEEINRLKIQIRETQEKYLRIIQVRQQQIRNIKVKFEGTENSETMLRKQIKQRDDQIKGLKNHLQDIQENYRRQIRQKQEQINRFKNKISKFDETIEVSIKQKDQEINKLNFTINNVNQSYRKQIRQKDDQINKLKIEVSNVQQIIRGKLRQKDQQINRMNASINNINQNYRKQLRQKDDQLNRIKIQLSNSDKEVRSRLREKQEENNRLKAQIGNINIQFQQLRKQLRDKDDQLRILQGRTVEIQQNYRRLISQKQLQIREISEKLFRLNQDKDRSERDVRNEYENKIKIIVQNQTNSLRSEITNLVKQKQLLGNQLIGVRKQLQSKIILIKSMQSEMAGLRKQRENHLQMISQLQSSFQQINIKIRTSNEGLDKKCHEQQIQIINLKKYIEQLENTINHTIEERDHLFNVSHQYKDEIVKLKQQISNNSKGEAAYYQIQRKYNQLTVKSRQYQQKINVLSTTISEMDAKIREYDRNLNEAINEIERLGTLLKDREGQTNLISELRQQLNMLSIKLTDITESAREWQQKYIQLYSTYNNQAQMHRNKMLDHQRKVAILQQQFEQLNSLIITLKQENTYLRVQVTESSDLIEKNKHLSAEIDRLNSLKQMIQKQLKDTRLVLIDQMALERRLQQNLSLFVVLFAEIQTLRKRVLDTETQCENVRRTSLTPHRVDRQVGRSLQSRTQTVTRIVRRQ